MGVAAILGAYTLASFGLLSPQEGLYQLLNLTGAVALGLEAYLKKDIQPAVLNLVWAVVALIGLLSVFR